MKKVLKQVSLDAQKQDSVEVVLFTGFRGSINYGLHKRGVSDLDCVCFFAPSKERLLLSTPQRPKKVLLDGLGVEYELIDIRHLLTRVNKANLAALDFLYSPHVIINPIASDLFRFVRKNAFEILKSRKCRIGTSHLGGFKSVCLGKHLEDVSTPKQLVQSFYFLQLSSLLLDIKKPERFMALATNASEWHTEFKHPDLMEVKFSPRGKEKIELYSAAVLLSLDLRERLEKLEDEPLSDNELFLKVKSEILKLILDIANSL